MSRTLFRAGLIAMAMSATMALTACGGAASAPTEGAATEGPSIADADRTAHLRVAYQLPVPGLNPHKLVSPSAAFTYVSPLYDRLTQIVIKGDSYELAPMVATEWEFAPDGLSATFTLRDGVTFSDGAVLDAAAVKEILDHATNAPGSTAALAFSMIDSVEVIDPTHVKINTNRPAADLPYALSASEGALISPNALDNPDLDVNPVGSGPYVATDVQLGSSITYERREGYWDETAQMAQTITITSIPDDNARLNALRSGQVDMLTASLNQWNEVQKLGTGFGSFEYAPVAPYSLYLNVDKPNLKDPRVRQALNYAIDRNGIGTSLTGGLCQPSDQPMPPGKAGYLESPPAAYDYNPDEARRLLAEAGASDMSLELTVGAVISPQRQMAAAIQSQLEEVGVTVNLVAGDYTDLAGRYASGASDSWLTTRLPSADPAQTLSNNYTSRSQFPGTVPPEFSPALAPAFDPNASADERTTALQAASSLVNEDALDLFICVAPPIYAVTDKVIGIDNMGISGYIGVMDLRYVGLSQ